jgi:hypothetical protein
MIHLVFQQKDATLLKEAMSLDETLQGEIVEIKDEWGVGPIKDLDTEEGWHTRLEWWRTVMQGTPYGEKMVGSFDDRQTVNDLRNKLEADTSLEVWIWMGQNQHDVTGYFWLMQQLKEFQGRILVVYLNNLPFINEKGQLFYPWNVHDILPKEVIKAKKLARPITVSEFETDPDEWKRISEENAMVRILEGGKKIVGKDESYYDAEIMKNITGEWQKPLRIIGNTLNRMKIKTGDVYLMWRLKFLLNEGKLEVLGNTEEGWKAFDVRKAGVQVNEIREEKTTAV